MKRFIIAISVLGLFLCGSVCSLLATRSMAGDVLGALEELRQLCVSKESGAEGSALELRESWEKKRRMLCMLVNSERLQEVQEELVRIPGMIEADADELLSVIDAAYAAAQRLYQGEIPLPTNFL